MKKLVVLFIALALIFSTASCGQHRQESSISASKPTNDLENAQAQQSTQVYNEGIITADKLYSAFKSNGYELESDTSISPDDVGDGISEVKAYSFAKWYDKEEYIGEIGFYIYAIADNEDSAVAVYETMYREMSYDDVVFKEINGNGYTKAIYVAPQGNLSIYGETIIIIRIRNTVIYINADWDDLQEVDFLSYNNDVAKLLESLGY